MPAEEKSDDMVAEVARVNVPGAVEAAGTDDGFARHGAEIFGGQGSSSANCETPMAPEDLQRTTQELMCTPGMQELMQEFWKL